MRIRRRRPGIKRHRRPPTHRSAAFHVGVPPSVRATTGQGGIGHQEWFWLVVLRQLVLSPCNAVMMRLVAVVFVGVDEIDRTFF